jgi:hypothetical protein
VPNSIITDNPVHWQEVPGILRQAPHPRGLGGCRTSTEQWSSGAGQWHDLTRPQAQDF